MTRAEINQSIKDAWVRELMDVRDLREDMVESYAAWVQGLIQAAAPELSGQDQASEAGGQGGGGQAPAGGGQPQGAAGGAPAPAPAPAPAAGGEGGA